MPTIVGDERSSPRKAPKRAIRRILRVAAVLFALLAAAVVLVLALTLSTPTWYTPPPPTAPTTIALADKLEQAAVSQLTQVRPADPAPTTSPKYRSDAWSVSISQDDANAWLAVRLPAWLASRQTTMPGLISQPFIRFDDGAATIAAAYEGTPRLILGQRIAANIDEAGDLHIALGATHAGRMTAPGSLLSIGAVRDMLTNLKGANVKLTDDTLTFTQPTLRLDDGRFVRVLGLWVKDGRLEVMCRTEK